MPSDAVQFLSVNEVIEVQRRLIERFGGQYGLRDRGLLESALFRPQTGYYEDLPAMAAALFESLLTNHAFVDGNKRVAFFATDVFLRINGWKLQVEPDAAHAFIVDLIERDENRHGRLRWWIGKRLTPLGAKPRG